MNRQEIAYIIQKSLKKLYAKDILLMNSAYDINERTVTHRLAMYLEPFFEERDYVVDVEYNRIRGDYNPDAVGNLMGKRLIWEKHEQGSSYVYPDIIVHKRDSDDNFLLLEVKMNWKNNRKQDDLLKINAYLKEFGYKHGAYLELTETQGECKTLFGPFNLSSL